MVQDVAGERVRKEDRGQDAEIKQWSEDPEGGRIEKVERQGLGGEQQVEGLYLVSSMKWNTRDGPRTSCTRPLTT